MQISRQAQSAGDNSQLIQAGTVVVQGVDEKRVREIFDEKTVVILREFSQEALETIIERVKNFEEDFVPKLVKENLVDALKNPSIQILLAEAQKSAASTEREADYSLLSELLVHRIKKGDDRYIRSGVSGAIKIVNEVSDEALLGLTALYIATSFVPSSLEITEGVKFLSELFSSIVYNRLPQGEQWLSHLDILSAVRLSSVSTLRKFEDYCSEKLLGYIAVGIEKNSSEYDKALEIVQRAKLPKDILCDHELRQGYVRLKMVNLNSLDAISILEIIKANNDEQVSDVLFQIPLSDGQKQAIREIYALYDSDTERRKENVAEFFKLWDGFKILKEVKNWWNNIPIAVTITPIGKSLAHANAQKHFLGLPEFCSN